MPEHAVPSAAPRRFLLGSPAVGCGTTLFAPLLDGDGGLLLRGPDAGAALLELALSPPAQDEHPMTSGASDHGDLQGLLAHHEAEARSSGRTGWGLELPGVPVPFLERLRCRLPGTRIVYVLRDLVAAASVAKNCIRLDEAQRLSSFAIGWRNGVIAAQSWRADPEVLLVDLEALEAGEATLLATLKRFTGVAHLQLEAFRRARVAESKTREALDEDELEILDRVVRPAVQPSAARGELAPWPRATLG